MVDSLREKVHLSFGEGKPQESSICSDPVDEDWASVSVIGGSKDIRFASVVGAKGELISTEGAGDKTGDFFEAGGGSTIGIELEKAVSSGGGNTTMTGIELGEGNMTGVELGEGSIIRRRQYRGLHWRLG